MLAHRCDAIRQSHPLRKTRPAHPADLHTHPFSVWVDKKWTSPRFPEVEDMISRNWTIVCRMIPIELEVVVRVILVRTQWSLAYDLIA